ncbi:hypothetical protein [Gudongella sp. SC589]|jgi:hypothetical protein|uniref:hypothetical protein n=1 Tax=Gudongella sp. SC589 TaxID=3385990 RepID=UPI00390474AC
MGKKKKKNKKEDKVEIWTEEQYEDYLKSLYGMEFIAGFTESGVPFGSFEGDDYKPGIPEKEDELDEDDDLPF